MGWLDPAAASEEEVEEKEDEDEVDDAATVVAVAGASVVSAAADEEDQDDENNDHLGKDAGGGVGGCLGVVGHEDEGVEFVVSLVAVVPEGFEEE